MMNFQCTMSFWFTIIYAITFITITESSTQETSFEDVRCKCVCPKLNEVNSTQDRTVYISPNVNPDMCTCFQVVKDATPKLCAQCECKYESRNTTTIKVVVIFIICVVSLLFVYMVFLFLLDHLVSWRPSSSYQQHVSEEVNLDEHSVTSSAPVISRMELTRQRSIINRVSDEQKKWKGTVQEQRKNIYDRHSMLN